MKGKITVVLILLAGLVSSAFAQDTDIQKEKELIREVINQETRYYSTGDFEKWKELWVHSPKALHTSASNIGFQKRKGWETIMRSLRKEIEDTTTTVDPEDLNMKRRDFHYEINGDMAWVHFMSTDNIIANNPMTDKMETRVLKKVNGQWKILYVNTINISTYEE